MSGITGFANPGTDTALNCVLCGDPCMKPAEHLAVEQNDSALLAPDMPCQTYMERNKWDHRWRVILVYVNGQVKHFIDDMGPEDGYKAPEFQIPSFGNDPTEWNTVGECYEIALDRHDTFKDGYESARRNVRHATGRAWAEELAEQKEMLRLERAAKSIYGPGGFTQRNRDWRT